MNLTIEEIKAKLAVNDIWVCRAVKAIYDCQTLTEQTMGETKENNGIGFNGVDANILSSFAQFYIKTGFLTPKQIAIARRKIGKYAGQLLKIAKAKACGKVMAENKAFSIEIREEGRGEPSIEKFQSLDDAKAFILKYWQGAEYVDCSTEFHTDYSTFSLVGFSLKDLGVFDYSQGFQDFKFNP